MKQLLLVPYDDLPADEAICIMRDIRNYYWFIRSLRNTRYGASKRRSYYRKVKVLKNKLLLAGVEKRKILDLVACCRLQCSGKKQPFIRCPYCV
jgi:hypothetical protein